MAGRTGSQAFVPGENSGPAAAARRARARRRSPRRRPTTSFSSVIPMSPAGICRAAASIAGESAPAALARELSKRPASRLLAPPRLHGIFFNPIDSRRDHVVCYVVDEFHCKPAHRPDLEIAEARFFPIDALPADATRATRARIDEVLRGAPVSELW